MGLRFLAAIVLVMAVVAPPSAEPFTNPSQAQGMDVAIIVHPDTPVSSLTLPEVRKLFRGERQYWSGELPVVLIVRAPQAKEREIALRVIYQMTEARFKQYWIAKIFRAEATSAPKLVYSNDTTNQLVAAIPGAVGFMPSKDVKPPLKVVQIEGKMPGEAGYVIR